MRVKNRSITFRIESDTADALRAISPNGLSEAIQQAIILYLEVNQPNQKAA